MLDIDRTLNHLSLAYAFLRLPIEIRKTKIYNIAINTVKASDF